jgi:hypothetical protein
MKVLVVSDIGTLGLLHDQALKNKSIQCVDKNALLYSSDSPHAWINVEDSPLQMCFGYHYNDLPPEDSRLSGKSEWFDFVVEIGSKPSMSFLCPLDQKNKYIYLDVCHSIITVVKALKNVNSEEE